MGWFFRLGTIEIFEFLIAALRKVWQNNNPHQSLHFISRLHYRITVLVLLVGVTLLSSKEYIGENIKCIVHDDKLKAVIERFCFFMATFTVPKHYNKSIFNREIAHPGVGPYVENSDDEMIRHTYYQWVPIVLFCQALCFYLPHLIWKTLEKSYLRKLVESLSDIKLLNEEKKRRSFQNVEYQLSKRLQFYKQWSLNLIICECLNLVNLIIQIYLTDVFLNHMFMDLGNKVFWDQKNDDFNPLDVVFPKVAKCGFKKFGPSGSIQYHDVMCVMALNIVNEKIFTFLWFWYIILFILTCWMLIWRLISFLLRNVISFNLWVFKLTFFSKIDKLNLITVLQNVTFGEKIFLLYLASNMGGNNFKDLLAELANSYEKRNSKSIENSYQESEKPLVEF